MEELDLKELFSYFLSKIAIIILIILIFVLGSFIYQLYFQTPLYNSYTTIVLTNARDSSSDSGTITQNDIILNQKLVSTYRDIMKSRRVLNKVIKNLKLDVEYEELKNQIALTTEQDTEIIKISVNDKDANRAKEVADEIADVFGDEIAEIYNIQNFSVIDYAVKSLEPYNINFLKQTVIAFALGLIVSIGIVFVMFYFDTTIKSAEEVETKVGLPILGTVPISGSHKGGKKNEK